MAAPPVAVAAAAGKSCAKLCAVSRDADPKTCEPSPGPLTLLLHRWKDGDASVEPLLLEGLYPLLHQLASRQLRREVKPQLRTTELAHEAYLDLFHGSPVHWQDERHFAALATQVVRRVVVDLARERQSLKRGGAEVVFSLGDLRDEPAGSSFVDVAVLSLHQALEELAVIDGEAARLVELRFFGGLEMEEIAEQCNCSVATLGRRWRFARAWLKRRLGD